MGKKITNFVINSTCNGEENQRQGGAKKKKNQESKAIKSYTPPQSYLCPLSPLPLSTSIGFRRFSSSSDKYPMKPFDLCLSKRL